MYEAIKNLSQQFLYEPEIKNSEFFTKKTSFLVAGMGGSALAAKLLKTWKPDLDITICNDYGLPEFSREEAKNKLIILSSYSGNTEETIDAFERALERGLAMAVISTGGKLLALAQENKIPYIELPNTNIQPRSAIGFSLKAFLKLLGAEDELKKITALAESFNAIDYENKGKELAEKMKNHIPVIYSSSRYLSLVYIWKIKLNETGKIPAFYNIFPELNHNEINGFDVKDSTKGLCDKFYFLILKDVSGEPRILKRIEVTEKLYKNRSLPVEILELSGENFWQKIFSSIVLADWVAYYTALQYGLDPDQVPMVEELKKLILD